MIKIAISCHPIVMTGRQASVLSKIAISGGRVQERIDLVIQIILSWWGFTATIF
jgi:hypothetical protein